MARRKIQFNNGEWYHVYNRGVEKRNIVLDKHDVLRFLRGLDVFNSVDRVGSIFEYDFMMSKKKQPPQKPRSRLVDVVAFNVLGNHYHLVLRQLEERGISTFMQSIGGGYTKYFNEKYKRVGPLFQGAFKAVYIANEFSLEETVAYVNLNHVIHKFGTPSSKWGMRSSLEQYIGTGKGIASCHFSKTVKPSKTTYLKKAVKIIKEIIKKREEEDKDLELGVPSKHHVV